jgi:hypothetical protein
MKLKSENGHLKNTNFMCCVRDEVPDSKTGDKVMYYLIRAIAHLKEQC